MGARKVKEAGCEWILMLLVLIVLFVIVFGSISIGNPPGGIP